MKKTSYPTLVLKQRDYAILKLVYKHRFLDSELIWCLIKNDSNLSSVSYSIGADGKSRPTTYGYKKQALSKRLKQLFDSGHLERHYITDQPIGRGYGSPRAIYGLGKQSSTVLQEIAGIPNIETRMIIEGNKVKSPFLRHSLEVTTFNVILEHACQQSNGTVKLLFWKQGDCIRDYVSGVNEKGEDERFTVYADAFFGLDITGRGKAQYFLEVDRGTMPITATSKRSDIRKKILGYWFYRKTQKHSKRYFYSKLPDGQIVGLGISDGLQEKNHYEMTEQIRGFSVLFVTPGQLDTDGTVGGRLANILVEFSALRKDISTSSLFWFTPLGKFNLESMESIFDKIWITPNPGKGLRSIRKLYS